MMTQRELSGHTRWSCFLWIYLKCPSGKELNKTPHRRAQNLNVYDSRLDQTDVLVLICFGL